MSNEHFPAYRGQMEYYCLNCNNRYPITDLLYTCPSCGSVLMLENTDFDSLKKNSGFEWQHIFDNRMSLRCHSLRGIFRFYELISPILEEDDIVYLGEGNTPIIDASKSFQEQIGIKFAFKNDGQNPSASFKDRGMACAFSYLKWLCAQHDWQEILTICASTGDTSAAAALYAAYVGAPLKSIVLLPSGKVTPQQLSQPLGSGSTVIELPGVFDDCMKVVENLAENYKVALLNSKNSWRILGQESYAYETAQWYSWDVSNLCVFVPIGNAGNVTAIMSGFLKLYRLNIIDKLPRIFGVQSEHANPVYKYYSSAPDNRVWKPVQVQPSVAQAAMIGNPVSFPRVRCLVDNYINIAGSNAFNVIQVTEQEIIEGMLEANRHGHIACTQGGECLAGLKNAIALNLIKDYEIALLDSTAHALKFADFQGRYFTDSLHEGYGITAKKELANSPTLLLKNIDRNTVSLDDFVKLGANAVAETLNLTKSNNK